jgi:multiple sugar transport system substrate-binding protein
VIGAWRRVVGGFCALLVAGGCTAPTERVLTISGSLLGREGEVLRRQLDRFRAAHPRLAVQLRATPDSADQRHQLYVQWLNAHVGDPDVLQLDVVWTAEFAAAGWIAALDGYEPPLGDFFPATVDAHRWRGAVYALPWFVDVGMLYWRTDLMAAAPADLEALVRVAGEARRAHGLPFGAIWQGARYEGLVTVFLEHLGAFGGAILDRDGAVVVDAEPAVQALTFMHDAVHRHGIVPAAALAWQEEQTRLAFQDGQAAFMRNWPYAASLLQAPGSAVAGRFAVAAMPPARAGSPPDGGTPTATLGGAALAVNAHSDQPGDAYRLIEFLLEPAQMLERAGVAGQLPSRPAVFGDPALAAALPIAPADAAGIIAAAVPRPVSPVYSELSSILQVALHRALTRQQPPREALREAAAGMRALLTRSGLHTS